MTMESGFKDGKLTDEGLEIILAATTVKRITEFTAEDREIAEAVLRRAGPLADGSTDSMREILTATFGECLERGLIADLDAGRHLGTEDYRNLARVGKLASVLLAAHHAELRAMTECFEA
ncbi:MAG TPA: hypothetical protein VHR97_11230 [Candidatus Baltobacteraceae bacterium]|jgi:hypothetical protein|nr:hypothetical protein [Candidatus Baltobacteraceae bacterium]